MWSPFKDSPAAAIGSGAFDKAVGSSSVGGCFDAAAAAAALGNGAGAAIPSSLDAVQSMQASAPLQQLQHHFPNFNSWSPAPSSAVDALPLQHTNLALFSSFNQQQQQQQQQQQSAAETGRSVAAAAAAAAAGLLAQHHQQQQQQLMMQAMAFQQQAEQLQQQQQQLTSTSAATDPRFWTLNRNLGGSSSSSLQFRPLDMQVGWPL
jgi:hypothetical protein